MLNSLVNRNYVSAGDVNVEEFNANVNDHDSDNGSKRFAQTSSNFFIDSFHTAPPTNHAVRLNWTML